MARPDGGNPLRTGIFGIVLVTCLVLVSFGYTNLPFWPQGRNYEAYFTDAGGITPGNDVNVSGIGVGKVSDVELAGDTARVKFTVDRDIRLGDQTLVSIKTDTVLGQKSLVGDSRRNGNHRPQSRWAALRLRTLSIPRYKTSGRTRRISTSRSSRRRWAY